VRRPRRVGRAPRLLRRCFFNQEIDMSNVAKGDKVSWNTSQGKTHGTVAVKVTGTAKAGGHTAHASSDDPQFRVKSDKTGKTAIHKASALKKSG
jgi:hypothetical protein